MSIFRSYDIRGIYGKDIDEAIMKRIGAAFSAVSTDIIAVASDMRISSESLKNALISGCKSVIDCGCVPLGIGMLHTLGKYDYAYITASHLPKEWNGVKFFHKNGIGFHETENKKIEKIFSETVASYVNKPKIKKENPKTLAYNYRKYVISKVKPEKKLHVVIDCGNGMASGVAKQIFTDAGFRAETIFDSLDGTFPNRASDPNEDPLQALRNKTASADIGIAYDGDADRMVLVDDAGRKLTPEQTSYLIMLGAAKENGPLIANIECTRIIDDIAKKFGKKVVRVPVGHTFLMNAVMQHKACFGVESAAHYALPSMAPFDDSLMVSVFAATVLSKQEEKLSDIVNKLKIYPFERVNFECSDTKKFIVVEKLKQKLSKEYKNVTTIDGVRVDFHEGWILVRASNTSPFVRLTAEAEDKKTLDKLKEKFSRALKEEIEKQK